MATYFKLQVGPYVTYSGGSDCFNILGFLTSSAPQKSELLITLPNCRLDAIFILW